MAVKPNKYVLKHLGFDATGKGREKAKVKNDMISSNDFTNSQILQTNTNSKTISTVCEVCSTGGMEILGTKSLMCVMLSLFILQFCQHFLIDLYKQVYFNGCTAHHLSL